MAGRLRWIEADLTVWEHVRTVTGPGDGTVPLLHDVVVRATRIV